MVEFRYWFRNDIGLIWYKKIGYLTPWMVKLISVEVITMAKQPNQSQAGTNIQQVRQQNAQSAQGGQGQFGTEFASETNAQEVRQQNQQAEARKAQNSGQQQQS
jgi:small acid-soluble spore protein E (minor gamma-type SASP)